MFRCGRRSSGSFGEAGCGERLEDESMCFVVVSRLQLKTLMVEWCSLV